MKKDILIFVLTILLCLPGRLFSQTYQLTGNPVNTTGWDLVSDAIVSGDFVRLTTDQTSKYGAVKLSTQSPLAIVINGKWNSTLELTEMEPHNSEKETALPSGILLIHQQVSYQEED